MKKRNLKNHVVLTGLLLIAVLTMSGCTGHKVLTRVSEPQKMIHFSELENWDEARSLNHYIIYLNKGDSFPLNLSMDTDFMGFKQDRIEVVAKQKLYFMIEMPEDLPPEELAKLTKLDARSFSEMSADQKKDFIKKYKLYLSKDALHWAPMYSPKAIRAVMGFKSGTISLGLMASTTEGLGASLIIRTIK